MIKQKQNWPKVLFSDEYLVLLKIKNTARCMYDMDAPLTFRGVLLMQSKYLNINRRSLTSKTTVKLFYRSVYRVLLFVMLHNNVIKCWLENEGVIKRYIFDSICNTVTKNQNHFELLFSSCIIMFKNIKHNWYKCNKY